MIEIELLVIARQCRSAAAGGCGVKRFTCMGGTGLDDPRRSGRAACPILSRCAGRC